MMPSVNKPILLHPRPSLQQLERQAFWLGLLALASSLHVFESIIPSFGPWFKLGLANIISLVVLVLMGSRAAIALAFARVVIGAFFLGTIFTPTFFISLSANMAATLCMIAAWHLIPRISLIGVSLLAACSHMLCQFWVVNSFFIQHDAIYYLLAPMLMLSCATGWINGALAQYIVAHMHQKPSE